MRRFLLVLIYSMIGIIVSPAALTAADNVALTDLDNANMVETVPIVEKKTEITAKAPAAGVKTTATIVPAAPAPAPVQIKNYTVSVFSESMILDCGNSICKTGKLLYAHNSANLFGNLSGISDGEIFTVTENGITTSYRVAEKAIYEKTADGYLNSNPYLMGNIMKTAMGHSMALMTCTGTSYGNGDASHRLVVYADAI